MKKRIFGKQLTLILLALVLVCLLLPGTSSAATAEEVDAANRLYELGLLQGAGTGADGKPDFALERTLTRHEAVAMLVRLLGKEEEAKAGTWDMPFTDVADWAKPYIGYAYANGLTNGTSATTFHGTRTIDATGYLTLVLRALGYNSTTDFHWSRAWELTDKLGITNGEYSAEHNTFLRGDMSLVSYDALAFPVKGTDTPLMEVIFPQDVPGEMPAVTYSSDDYLMRKLSNAQITDLKNADLATVQAEISTLSDAVAWLDSFNFPVYSGLGDPIRLGFNDLYNEAFGNQVYAPEVYTALCGYLICDDFDGIQLTAAHITSDNSSWFLNGLCLPVKNGWFVVSPVEYSSIKSNDNNEMTSFAEQHIASLDLLKDVLKGTGLFGDAPVEAIFLADAGQPMLSFTTSDGIASVHLGSAQCIYLISQAEKQALAEQRRLGRVAYAFSQIQENWSTYNLPTSQAPTLTREEAEALYGKDLETVAAAVKTIGDCIYYYAGAGFDNLGGDLYAGTGTSLFWHFNYAPRQALINNYGCCGTISGLTARLLEGDFDITGIIGMTFSLAEGGGHVINWVKDGDQCYVFDMINLISNGYHQRGFQFTSGANIQEAADLWSQASGWTERLMYAYQSFDGDAPVGWDWDNSNISYLPDKYKDTAIILLETPEEGYVYEWVTIDDETWARINAIRVQD